MVPKGHLYLRHLNPFDTQTLEMLPASSPAQWATINQEASEPDCTLPCPGYPGEVAMCEGASVETVVIHRAQSRSSWAQGALGETPLLCFSWVLQINSPGRAMSASSQTITQLLKGPSVRIRTLQETWTFLGTEPLDGSQLWSTFLNQPGRTINAIFARQPAPENLSPGAVAGVSISPLLKSQ